MEHLLHLVQTEQSKEIQRTADELGATWMDEVQAKSTLARIQRERQETADWVMRILARYKYLSAMEEASYLTTQLRQIATELEGGTPGGVVSGGVTVRATKQVRKSRQKQAQLQAASDEDLLARLSQ